MIRKRSISKIDAVLELADDTVHNAKGYKIGKSKKLVVAKEFSKKEKRP